MNEALDPLWEALPGETRGRRIREFTRVKQVLRDESVLALAEAKREMISGLLVSTSRRILFVSQGFMAKAEHEITYDSVSAVDTSKTVLGGWFLRIAHGGQTTKFDGMQDRYAHDMKNVISAQASEAAGGPARGTDVLHLLNELGSLHRAGVLTDAEFAAKKSELLGRL
jgi:hypothetical protein